MHIVHTVDFSNYWSLTGIRGQLRVLHKRSEFCVTVKSVMATTA